MSTGAWIAIIILVIIIVVGFMYLSGRNTTPPLPSFPPVMSQLPGPSSLFGPPSEQPSITPFAPSTAPITSPFVQSNPVSMSSVTISDFAFTPAVLTVKAGTTVTWTNNDSVGHDVKGNTFRSPTMQNGDTYKYTFTAPGTYDYICSIHPSMKGRVVVQ